MFPDIRLSDSIVLPTYLLFLSLLYCFLILYVFRRAEARGENSRIALDFSLILMLAGFIVGRIFHVLYEAPQYYWPDWTRIFQFWQGGFVFYGGFLTAFITCWLYSYRQKLPFLAWADFFAPVFALGYGLGRISCFLAGCCYGRACRMPWGVKFPWDAQQIQRHPTQLYAVGWELAVYGVLIVLEKRNLNERRPGGIFFQWVFLHSIGRLLMEYFRDDFRGSSLCGLSISSWVSLILMCVASCWLTFRSQKKLRI